MNRETVICLVFSVLNWVFGVDYLSFFLGYGVSVFARKSSC